MNGISRVEPLLRITTTQLLHIAGTGRDLGFERTLDPRVEHFIDPNACHILQNDVVLKQRGGVTVPAFIRSTVRIACIHTDASFIAKMDVRLCDWLVLPALTDLHGAPLHSDEAGEETVLNIEFTVADVEPDDRTPLG